MKKLVSIFMCLSLILSVTPLVQAASFKDVSTSYTFYEEIDVLVDNGIISGFPDGSFKPNQSVTRAEAAIMIGRALGLDGSQKETKFTDVAENSVASGYIQSAVDAGIIQGFTDGTYKPNRAVTRGQLAIFLARAFNLEDSTTVTFTDVSSNMIAYPYIGKLVDAGITNGYSDGTYRPNQAVTRGQFSAFLARALGLVSVPEVTWNGYWTNEFGYLSISNETADSFDFHINVVMGANNHSGDILGTAYIHGTTAVYTEYIEDLEGFFDDPTCRITFTHNGDSIRVVESGACIWYHGVAATFDGVYSK